MIPYTSIIIGSSLVTLFSKTNSSNSYWKKHVSFSVTAVPVMPKQAKRLLQVARETTVYYK